MTEEHGEHGEHARGPDRASVEVEPDDERRTERLGERLTQQLAGQWALLRAERRAEPEPITTGPSNFSRAQVPWGLDLAAAWSWRVLVIAVAVAQKAS